MDIRDGYPWVDRTQQTNLLEGLAGSPAICFYSPQPSVFLGEAASPSPERSVHGIPWKPKDKRNPLTPPAPRLDTMIMRGNYMIKNTTWVRVWKPSKVIRKLAPQHHMAHPSLLLWYCFTAVSTMPNISLLRMHLFRMQ